MKIEVDQVEITSGVRHGKTLGSPITLVISNRDWENWEKVMDVWSAATGPFRKRSEASEPLLQRGGKQEEVVTRPRPGHADLAGAIKYDQSDIRNVLERASARETASRVAVSAVAKSLLSEFGVKVISHVIQIGPVIARTEDLSIEDILREKADSPVSCADGGATRLMISEIEKAGKAGDTIGGVFEVIATGAPVGLGSFVHWDRKLDARLAGALMSIQAIKGVEIGLGFEASRLPGSKVHDEIFYSPSSGFFRTTNRAGGLEGGVTNGEPLIIRAAMKPISTLIKPLKSVDLVTKRPTLATVERSDICAVPAAAVVGEAAVAFELASAMIEKFGGDSLREMKRNYDNYMSYVKER
jgi:chorismate synthase